MNIIPHKQGLLLLFSAEQLFSLKIDNISWLLPFFLCCSKVDISKDKNGDITDNKPNKRNKKLDIHLIFFLYLAIKL